VVCRYKTVLNCMIEINFYCKYIFCCVVSNHKIYFSSNIKNDKTFYFGSVDVQLAPVKYIECVQNLLKYCQKTTPWIVNTMGMVRGYGLELLVDIIKLHRPPSPSRSNIHEPMPIFRTSLRPPW
jgi:mRNA cleavage and polyadenylation factor CLP1 P-loop